MTSVMGYALKYIEDMHRSALKTFTYTYTIQAIHSTPLHNSGVDMAIVQVSDYKNDVNEVRVSRE